MDESLCQWLIEDSEWGGGYCVVVVVLCTKGAEYKYA